MSKTNKPYQKPELTKYGDLSKITAAKNDQGGDGGSSKGSRIA